MTPTRATLPSLIFFQYSKSHKQRQAIANNEKPQQATTNHTTDYGLQFRHAYDILNVPYTRKETNRDYDGRISNSRRGCTNAQDIRGFNYTASATREIAWIQDRGFVACGSERVAGVSSKEEEYSEQEINVGIDQYYQVVKQPSLSYQPSESCHSSRYPLISILPYHVWQGQVFFVRSAQRIGIMWVAREVMSMFTPIITIGIPLSQVYPYTLMNYAPSIFGVCGSEVAV